MNDSVVDSYRVADQQRQILGELARLLLASSCVPSVRDFSQAPDLHLASQISPALRKALGCLELNADSPVDQLPQRLVAGWATFARSFQSDPELPGYASVQQQLLIVQEIANLVLRFRSTQENSAGELAELKREAIYHLAYGLSHELNNPLAILGAQASALAESERDPVRLQKLETMITTVARGAEMIRDLMLVARPASLHREPTGVSEVFEAIVRQAREWAGPWGVEIEDRLDFGNCEAQLDVVAIREAIWALLRNSIEACSPEGRIRISGGREVSSITLVIEDDGPGLSTQALKHCFDPYYSGRESGRGLGLGLAKAERIIVGHFGSLMIKNLPTMGCSAIVELPSMSQ